MRNFAFLQSEWLVLYEAATKAEGLANTDARTSCFYARRTLKIALAWLSRLALNLGLRYANSTNIGCLPRSNSVLSVENFKCAHP